MEDGTMWDDEAGFERIKRHQRRGLNTSSTQSRINGMKRSRSSHPHRNARGVNGIFRRRTKKFR